MRSILFSRGAPWGDDRATKGTESLYEFGPKRVSLGLHPRKVSKDGSGPFVQGLVTTNKPKLMRKTVPYPVEGMKMFNRFRDVRSAARLNAVEHQKLLVK